MTKRNTFSGGRGHAGQVEEDEARDCRAKRHGVFDNSKLLLAEGTREARALAAAQRKKKRKILKTIKVLTNQKYHVLTVI